MAFLNLSLLAGGLLMALPILLHLVMRQRPKQLVFPALRFIMPHGGGTVPFQAARYRALALMNKWEPFEEFIKRFYFDTTVYSQDAMELLVKVVGVDNIIFASEMLGGVNTTDPMTGRSFDDNKPCLDAIGWLTAPDRKKIFEDNVKKAYPRVGRILQERAQP